MASVFRLGAAVTLLLLAATCPAQEGTDTRRGAIRIPPEPAITALERLLVLPGAAGRPMDPSAFRSLDPEGTAAIPALIRLLDHPSRRVREVAADALGDFGERAAPSASALLHAFLDWPLDDVPVEDRFEDRETRLWRHRAHFVRALGAIGPAVGMGTIIRLAHIRDDSDAIFCSIALVLPQLDPQGLVAVEFFLQHLVTWGADPVCIAAADALAALGPRAAEALSVVRWRQARDPWSETGRHLQSAVEAMTTASPELRATLIGELEVSDRPLMALDAIDARMPPPPEAELAVDVEHHPTSAAGIYAAHRLYTLGVRNEDTLSALIAALRTDHSRAQAHAARAIGSMGPRATRAIPELMRIARDLYTGAQDRLAKVRSEPESSPSDQDPVAREYEAYMREREKMWPQFDHGLAEAVIESLGRMGPAAKSTLPLIQQLFAIWRPVEWGREPPLFGVHALERIDPPVRTSLGIAVDPKVDSRRLPVPEHPREAVSVEREPDGRFRVTVSRRGDFGGPWIEIFLGRDGRGRPAVDVDLWNSGDCCPPFSRKAKCAGGVLTVSSVDWDRDSRIVGTVTLDRWDWPFELPNPFKPAR